MEFGSLEEVEVRHLWKHEQYDFSNWLARPESIERLNDVLGLTLTDVKKEVFVGAYRCDLVAKDETTGTKVIIENQLEASNHDHLGKIITYASGLDAKVIVWIVTQAREEHRSAIEWLNNNTGNDIGFFLIELHAYRIGDSLPAPKFEIIEKPNGFIKYSKENSDNNEINKSQSERLTFWTRFNEMVVAKGKPFNIRNATTDHWYNVAIGTSEACVSINLVNKLSRVTVEISIADNKNLFDYLTERKDEIENALGFPMEWVRLDNKKASRIKYAIPGLNFDDHSNYDALMDKIIEKVIVLKKVFPEYIAQF